jgi:hypothetical protein
MAFDETGREYGIGGAQPVESIELLRRQHHVQGAEIVLCLGEGAGTHDGRYDRGVRQRPCERYPRRCRACLVGNGANLVRNLERAFVEMP